VIRTSVLCPFAVQFFVVRLYVPRSVNRRSVRQIFFLKGNYLICVPADVEVRANICIFTPHSISFEEHGFETVSWGKSFSKNSFLPVNLFILKAAILPDFLLGFSIIF
jgi:hypothetical protein